MNIYRNYLSLANFERPQTQYLQGIFEKTFPASIRFQKRKSPSFGNYEKIFYAKIHQV